jgi:predicted permease
VRRIQMVEGTLQDLRYGARTLMKNPGFFLLALITLALGIGANASVFSIVNGVLLKPLPYEDPDELVWIAERSRSGGANWVTWANFRDWRAESRSFQALSAFDQFSTTVLGGDQPLYTPVATVSRDFWSVFPVSPLAGRLSVPADHVEGGSPVAVVSESLANQALGGEAAVGRGIEVSGVWHEVVGIVPSSLDFPEGTQVWTPAELTPKSESRTSHNWRVVGRLHEGLTASDAALELDPMTVRLVASAQDEQGAEYLATGTVITSLQDMMVGNTRRPLFLLLGAAAFVLLVACTNLASTLLARGTARARELAVRSAIGASRTRIVRQLLSEAALLAVLGGAAGVGLTLAVLRGIRATAAGSIPRMEAVSLDGRVLLFTMAVTLVTGLAFGLLPALRARENDQAGTLRTEGRGNEGYEGKVWGTLVAAEVALALVLLTGSGLLIRSFTAVLSERSGLEGDDVVLSGVALSQTKYPDMDDHRLFWEDMLARAEALPGVSGAGLITATPFSGLLPNGLVHLDGDPSKTGNGDYIIASSGAFGALDIPLLRGRLFDESDGPDARHAVVVSESFAESYWPGEDPIGKQVSGGGMDNFWSADSPVFGTVVGVVGDVRYRYLTSAGRPTVYWNYRQRPFRIQWGANLVVESASGDPATVAGSLRRALQERDPDVAPRIRYLRNMAADSIGDRRFTLLIMSGFAAIGLLMAALGIFGVVSYAAAQRTREMGIRLALGASGGAVRSMVLRSAMVPVVLGLVAGVAGAWSLSRVMAGLLYEVTPNDPLTFLAVTALLLGTGLLASWIPAVRGTRVDPMITMRGE